MILVLFVVMPSGISNAETLDDNFIPLDERENVGDVELLYNKYPISHYKLDTHAEEAEGFNFMEKTTQTFLYAGNHITNLLFKGIVWFIQGTIFLLNEAFQLEFINGMIEGAARSIQILTGFDGGFSDVGIYTYFIGFLVSLMAIWAAYHAFVRGKSSTALTGVLSTFIVLVFALGFVMTAEQSLKFVNQGSSVVSKEVLSQTSKVAAPGKNYNHDESLAAMNNQIYTLGLYKPYLMLQFGTINEKEIGKERIHKVLSTSGEDREEVVKDEIELHENEMMKNTSEVHSSRIIFICLIFLFVLIMAITLLIFIGRMTFYSLLFIFKAITLPFNFLLGLLPYYSRTAWKGLGGLISPLLMKIYISILVSIVLFVSSAAYAATEQEHFFVTMFVQIIVFIGALAYQNKLIIPVRTRLGVNEPSWERFFEKWRSTEHRGGRQEEINRSSRTAETPRKMQSIHTSTSRTVTNRAKPDVNRKRAVGSTNVNGKSVVGRPNTQHSGTTTRNTIKKQQPIQSQGLEAKPAKKATPTAGAQLEAAKRLRKRNLRGASGE